MTHNLKQLSRNQPEDGSPPTARLLQPRPQLAGLLFAAIVRDTRHVSLPAEQRYNHFPVSPLCSVSWFFEGCSHMLAQADPMTEPSGSQPLPQLVFSGPFQRPAISWNPGPVYAMTLAIYPESWLALTGIDVGDLVDRAVPLEDLLSSDLLSIFHSVLHPGTSELRLRRLEDALEPLWQDRRPRDGGAPYWLQDWTRNLAVRAATSGPGISTRQMQRRIKSWTGQSQRQLQSYARTEELFAKSLSNETPAGLNLSQLAIDSGFADQSHMGREVRRLTGEPPGKINRLIATDERFWCYRLLGERFQG